MKFWMDVRLATEAGETVQRRRISGSMANDKYEAFMDRLLTCLGEYSPVYGCEEDRSLVGGSALSQAAK